MALRLVLFAVAASCVSAFGVFPTAQTATTVVGTTVTSSKLNSPVASRQRHGILAARASGDIAEKISEDGGGSPALAVAVAGGSGRAGATSKAAVAASVQKAVKTASALQVDAAFDPELAAEEATKTRAQAVTTRAAKSVIRSLPGTWWTAGLPKWMHLVRRRMITKEDWMHLHAASGAVSQDLGRQNTRLPVAFFLECLLEILAASPSPPCPLPPLARRTITRGAVSGGGVLWGCRGGIFCQIFINPRPRDHRAHRKYFVCFFPADSPRPYPGTIFPPVWFRASIEASQARRRR